MKVVRVDDLSKLPVDYVDADGTRVIGLEFAGGAAGMAQPALGRITGPHLLRRRHRRSASSTTARPATPTWPRSRARTTATALRDDGAGALALRRHRQRRLHQQPRRQGPGDGLCRPHHGQRRGRSPTAASSSSTSPARALGDCDPRRLPARSARHACGSTRRSRPATGVRQLNGTVSDLVAQTMNIQGDVGCERAHRRGVAG